MQNALSKVPFLTSGGFHTGRAQPEALPVKFHDAPSFPVER